MPARGVRDDEACLPECLDLARAWGADLAAVGVVEGRRAVSLAVGLSHAVLEGVRRARAPTPAYAHHYRTANALLDQVALRLARALAARGWEALPVPASQYEDEAALLGLLPHKTAAVTARLGWIGRSGLLLVPGLGPRVRLATVLLDCDAIEPGPGRAAAGAGRGAAAPGRNAAGAVWCVAAPQAPRPHPCAGCHACVEGCPAGAITGRLWSLGLPREDMVDVRRCSDWMTSHYRAVGGEICGLCVSSCPRGWPVPGGGRGATVSERGVSEDAGGGNGPG